MKKPILLLALVSWTFLSFSQNLSISKSVPNESSGAYFDVTFEVSIDMSTMYGTIYFDLSELGGVQSMEILNDYDFDDSKPYPPGSPLSFNGGGNTTMKAEYWLVSAWNNGYDGYETLKVKVRVKPNQSGEINLYYRATYINGTKEVRKPSNSSYKDQQKWYCYKATILNKPDKLPNVYIKDIKVNDGKVVYLNESVKIEVIIKENNGVDAGTVGINYFVNNTPVIESDDPDDYTGSLEANEEDQESVYHKFDKLGSNQIKVIVDPYNNLPESEENDNIKYHTINVIKNNSKPTVTITKGPSNNETIDYDDVAFSWSGTDSDGTVNGYEYEFDGSVQSTGYTTKAFNDLSEGKHTFKIRCFDNENDYSDWKQVDFTVDLNKKPTVTITKGPSNNETIDYDDVAFSWSGTDSDGTVNGYEYEFDGSGQSTGYTTKAFNDLSEGKHTFKIRCFDNENDYSDWKQVDFTVDLDEYLSEYHFILTYDNSTQKDTVVSLIPYEYYDDETGENTISWFAEFGKSLSLGIHEGMLPYLIKENVANPLFEQIFSKNIEKMNSLIKVNIPLPRSWFPGLASAANSPFLHTRLDLGDKYNPFIHFNVGIGKNKKKFVSFIGQKDFVKTRENTIGQLIKKSKPKFLTNLNAGNFHINFGTLLGAVSNILIVKDIFNADLYYGDFSELNCESWAATNYSLIENIITNQEFEPITKSPRKFFGEYMYLNLKNTPCEQYTLIKVRAKGVSEFCNYSSPFKVEWLNAIDFVNIYYPIYLYDSKTQGRNCEYADEWTIIPMPQGARIKITYPKIAGYKTPDPEILEVGLSIIEIEKVYIPDGTVLVGVNPNNIEIQVKTPSGLTITDDNKSQYNVVETITNFEKKWLIHDGYGTYEINIPETGLKSYSIKSNSIINVSNSANNSKINYIFFQNSVSMDTLYFNNGYKQPNSIYKVINEKYIPTNLDMITTAKDIILYPTITKGEINLITDFDYDKVMFEIVCLQGQIVQSSILYKNNGSKITLDSELTEGLYIIKAKFDKIDFVKKIILKRNW